MDFKTETTEKLAFFLSFMLSQLLIANGNNDYIFITQPPAELLCNPHSTDSFESSLIGLECSIGIIGQDQLPTDTRIVWFRRKPNDEEVQLCETDIATLMAATPFTGAQSVLLRSVVQLRASQLGDLSGEYWCQVAKTIEGDQTILSNSSSVLSIRSSQYYKHLDNCKVGSVFLEISFTSPSVEFSSPPVTTEEFFCSNSTADGPSVEPERVDDSFILPRMWVYILAPVIAAVLILIFLILLIATCVQKRGSKRKHPSIIDIELDDNIDSDAQIKSNGLPGNATAVSVNICNTSQTPTSKSSSAHVDLSKQLLNKQLLQQRDDDKEQAGPKDNDQDSDNEEYYYTHVPSRNDRNAAEVVGRLKGACTGVQPGLSAAPAETGHDSDDAACLEYRSLDPEAMDPTHMYHEMRSNSADGPQPTYSEPGVHGHRKLNGHRPTPPMKAPPRPPRPRGGESKLTSHVPLTSVPSVDGEYVDPNNRNSHLYQGLTPERQEYLALYMTPDSSPH